LGKSLIFRRGLIKSRYYIDEMKTTSLFREIERPECRIMKVMMGAVFDTRVLISVVVELTAITRISPRRILDVTVKASYEN
jgi:hypothetical protein